MRYVKNTLCFLGLLGIVRALRSLFYCLLDLIGVFVFSLLRFLSLIPRAPGFEANKINKILLIRLDRIGDVVLSTPAIRAVRESFPQAEIHLLVQDYTKDVVINNPNIDRLLIGTKDKLDKNYDLAIALYPDLYQNYLTFLSGAKFKIGYTGWGGGFFLTQSLRDDRLTRPRHEVESALEIVRLAGCKTQNLKLEVSVTERGEAFAEDFFRRHNIGGKAVIVHPGARYSYVRWLAKGFAEVADRVTRELDAKVILTASKSEEGLIKEVMSLMKEAPVPCVGFELTQLISIIKKSSLFVGNASGPMHIACALGVPVVAISGMRGCIDDVRYWSPWQDKNTVVNKDAGCKTCHPSDCLRYRCLELISTDDVFAAIKNQLGQS